MYEPRKASKSHKLVRNAKLGSTPNAQPFQEQAEIKANREHAPASTLMKPLLDSDRL